MDRIVLSVAHESLHIAVNSALEPYPTYPFSSVPTLGTFDGWWSVYL